LPCKIWLRMALRVPIYCHKCSFSLWPLRAWQ
jgi:hypothetical protein